MTKFQKQMLTIAAAGALTAVTALPAMAFENEFHGMYTFKSYFSNFDKGDGAQISPYTYQAKDANGNYQLIAPTYSGYSWSNKNKMNNYFDQRGRIQYIAKASDDLKLVTHFEFNTRFGGVNDGGANPAGVWQQSFYPGKSDGGTLDTDGLNIWTKHFYLDFNIGKNFNTKVGLIPYKDTIKGLLIDADIPAVFTTTKVGSYTLGLGFSRFDEMEQGQTTTTRLGDKAKDLFIMDNTVALSKDTKVALSYYLLADYKGYDANAANMDAWINGTSKSNYDRMLLHTFALSGETKLGGINLSGFAAMQAGYQAALTGVQSKHVQQHGWAANVAANMKVGSGKAKTAFLFASGNNSNSTSVHQRGWVSSGVNSYNESGMMLIARNTSSGGTSSDNWLRKPVTNIALATIGYDADITEKFFVNSNAGFAWAPSSYDAPYYLQQGSVNLANIGTANSIFRATANKNQSDFMGTELNLEAGYKLYKNLTLKAQAAYMILGGYYKNSTVKSDGQTAADPENPYTMRLQASYTF